VATFNGSVTGGSLILRQSAGTSSANLGTIPNGTALSVSTVNGNYDWFSTSYNSQTGCVMARYIAITTGGTVATVTTSSGSLNIRATPSSGASVSFQVAHNATVRVLDTTANNGFYRIGCPLGTGWGSTAYLTLGGSSGGGTSQITYNRTAAANYAESYAINYNPSYTDYGTYGNNNSDCANFASQCLYAGGMYKSNAWRPSPSHTESWTGTISQKNYLEQRGWGGVATSSQMQKGDLVYTYSSSAGYEHVRVVSNVISGTIYVCGHDSDQLNVSVSSPPSGKQYVYFHISDQQTISSSDFRN
jgi:uncharacterized protein YraI